MHGQYSLSMIYEETDLAMMFCSPWSESGRRKNNITYDRTWMYAVSTGKSALHRINIAKASEYPVRDLW